MNISNVLTTNIVTKLFFGTFVAIAVVGCSTMSKQECLASNWQAVGYEDGQNGVYSAIINDYQKDCFSAGIQVDVQAWRAGYQQGLTTYCVAENGFRVGKAGLPYHGVCSNDLFVKRYNEGHQAYRIEQRKLEINRQIQSLNYRLNSLGTTEADKVQRAQLKSQLKALKAELAALTLNLPATIKFDIRF
jgi:hypothetical protein